MAKRIVYVSNASLPLLRANAVHIMRMCDAFVDNGADVVLYCDDDGDVEKMYDVYGVKHRFPIYAPNQGLLLHLLKGFAGNLIQGWKNARIIKRKETSAYVYGRSLPIIFFLGNCFKFSYEVHVIPSNPVVSWMERHVLKRKNLVSLVTISNPLKEYYSKLMPRELDGKIVVLHDGANVVEENTTARPVLNNSKSCYPNICIGYIGSLYPGKSMEVLIPIAKLMPKVLFHIVGGDTEWVNHWKKVAKVESVSNLVFYGKMRPAEVSAYYDALDICLMPYSNNVYVDKNKKQEIGKWISPLKLFEAMAHGKPIIVTDLPSIREVMDNGKDALLINADDTKGWVHAIENLAGSFELRQELSENARKKLELQYSWKVRTQKILSKIDSI